MKFGVREICNVTFKTTAKGQKVGRTTFGAAGMPAFHIDTATTSSLEQASNTVYAQGGRGNNRLIAWEGEKTMTFTVEDALISPQGLGVLTGAGLVDPTSTSPVHVHMTKDIAFTAGKGELTLEMIKEETYLNDAEVFYVCNTTEVPVYGTIIDGSGADKTFLTAPLRLSGGDADVEKPVYATIAVTKGKNIILTAQKYNTSGELVSDESVAGTIKVDFYIVRNSSATQVTIEPNDFGGYFYVEADTLFRREDTGIDMAATITLPKVKVQSAFTFTMAASGDPSTFTFTMDAFPSYTYFDKTKKVICTMEILGADGDGTDDEKPHPIHSI